MKKNITITAALIVLIGLFYFLSQAQEQQEQTDTTEEIATAQESSLSKHDFVVVRTSDRYVPSEISIRKGETILWTNESGDFHWPASNIHPTHSLYPEFDPLTPIAPNETWSFTFDMVGEWKFHDHLRANLTGTVTVVD